MPTWSPLLPGRSNASCVACTTHWGLDSIAYVLYFQHEVAIDMVIGQVSIVAQQQETRAAFTKAGREDVSTAPEEGNVRRATAAAALASSC